MIYSTYNVDLIKESLNIALGIPLDIKANKEFTSRCISTNFRYNFNILMEETKINIKGLQSDINQIELIIVKV